MTLNTHSFRRGLAAGLLIIAGAVVMLPFGKLHDLGSVPWFLLGGGIMVAGYFFALLQRDISTWLFWAVAIGARLLLLWQAPGDDIFRYVWEGRILLAGFNPYLHSPDSPVLEMMRSGVWEAVQHKPVTAIYPPLAQWVFAVMAGLVSSPVFFKLVFALCDLGIVVMLVRAFGKAPAVLYAWNPLVIYSFAGGGHYDALFIFAMVFGWLAWRKDRFLQASLWLGAAVAIKWLALPLVGWLLWQQFWKHGWRAAITSSLLAALPFVVSWVAVSAWTGEWTVQLMPQKFVQYARSAEFIPAIVGWLWEESTYRNQWVVFPMAIAWALVILRARTLEVAAQWIFFVALIFSPLLHAWYFAWLMPFAVMTRNLGSILLTATAFIYFLLYHHVESPGGSWSLKWWETGLLWIPFVIGFLWSEWRRVSAQRDSQ